MKDKGFKTRLGDITKIKSQSGHPIELESGQVIINKVSTKQNLEKLVDINNDSTKKPTSKVTDDGTAGGLLEGPAHYDANGKSLGGIKAIVDQNKEIEVEGEEFVVNKEASQKHWKELSKINQSAGNGVAIGPPADYDDDPKEFKDGGKVIDFNPNHVPSKMILNYAKKIKKSFPEIWKLGGNIFGNEAFINLKRVSERGYWLDSEEWMYIKWRSYVARHIHDFRIEGVIAMLKWVDKVEKGWPYMKNLIEKEIEKLEAKKLPKMSDGGNVDIYNKGDVWRIGGVDYYFDESYIDNNGVKKWKTYKVFSTPRDKYTGTISIILSKTITDKRLKEFPDIGKKYGMDVTVLFDIKYNDGGSVSFKEKYNKKYGYSKDESHNLKEISEDTGVSTKGLQQIYNKGIGAYKTNPESVRPNVKSKEQWAKARVYSAVMGGKAAKVDAKELKMEKGGGLNDCIYFIKNSEAIKNNGYYLEFKNLSIYIGSGDKVTPKIKSIFLITYNSSGQKNLKPIDTINSMELANKLANLLNVEIGVARIIVSEQVTHSKRFEINKINSIVNKNIIIADRDTIVCTNLPMKLSNGGLIAPNGKTSNLTREQYKLVRTPEFKAWFGDWENDPKNASKVVDKNGEPKVYYQGLPYRLYPNGKNIYEQENNGIFFTSEERIADTYGVAKSVFINCRNPKDVRNYFGYDGKKISDNFRNDNKNWFKPNEHNEYINSDLNVIKFYEDVIDKYGKSLKFFDYNRGTQLVFKNKQEIKKFLIPTSEKGFSFINFSYRSAIWDLIGKYIKNSEYDGLFATDEDRLAEEISDSIVVYNSNQIKLADSTNTTFDGSNPDIRFEYGGGVDYELVSTLNLNSIRNQDKSNWDYDLEKSIEKKGILEPVTIGYWPEENVITLVDGHHRLDSAMDLGIEKIPTTIEKYYDYPYGKHRLYPVPRINYNATKPSDLGIFELGGKVDNFNFTSYADAQLWMNENSKKFKNQNEFYASDEYRLAYPIIQQLYKLEQKSYAAKAQEAMIEANVKFGDKVNYDYITPFLQSEKYSGTIIERNGVPFVKLDDGQQTISGAKSVKWHKGWKKNKFENGGEIDKKDTLTLDVPLMIRLLELSRENIKSDAELHFLVEKLIELKNKPVLTMEDYAFIADLEDNHLKKLDLGGKVSDSQREVDLGFGGLGNGTTVWDRNRIQNNDYKIVAHISNSGNITYYDKNLPENAKSKIEEMAMKEKQDFENQNGLSSGYEFMPINTPLN